MKVRRKIGDLGKAQIQQLVQDFLDELDEGAVALLEHFEESDTPEYLAVELDEEKKVLSFTANDGSHYAYNLKSETIDALAERITALEESGGIDNFENITDVEGRVEIKEDSNKRIVSYRDTEGVLHENAGIKTPEIELSKEGLDKLASELDIKLPEGVDVYKVPNVPKYGTTNIKTETFYLTADPRVSSINDVYLIFDFEDTDANAADRMTIAHYYIKSTLTNNGDGTYSKNANSVRLQHYAWGKVELNPSDNKFYAKDPVRKIDGVCYYADTLGYTSTQAWIGSDRKKVIPGYTRVAPDDPTLAEGAAKQTLVEVVEITGPACVNAWTVEGWESNARPGTDIGKKYDHKCLADIDFGHFLSGTNMAIAVKHQGNSTPGYRKRNFRYTFYKNNTFAKKDKVKIGSMLRLSKFNVKANWLDNTRIKELILYRIFYDIWQNRPITDRYDWDNDVNGLYNGASGNIVSFPCRLNVNNDFYGVYVFALPKDGKNYNIDDEDEDTGMLICGSGNTANDWGVNLPYPIPQHYDSEMDEDDLNEYPGIIAAMEEWTHFINGRLYKGTDDNIYNTTELTEVGGKMYVTSTLVEGQVVESSVEAKLIKFNRENISKRFDVLGFIDYLICLQVFLMIDNVHNNIMFYSGPEKKKMFPFFYDLDSSISMSRGVESDIFADGVSLSSDLSLWRNFMEVYWDDIVNRYCELRKTYLSIPYISEVYNDIKENIPSEDYDNENQKWSVRTSSSYFENIIEFLTTRVNYLDTNYFKI